MNLMIPAVVLDVHGVAPGWSIRPSVMPALVAGIHVFVLIGVARRGWPGHSSLPCADYVDLSALPAMRRIKFYPIFSRPLSRQAALFQVWIRPALDRHLRTDALQLQCQRPVVGARGLVLRIEFDGGAEIGECAGPVALFVPEFAAGIEDIRQRRVEPQRRVVIADGTVDHVLAVIGAGTRDQRLDAVGLPRLVVV